MRTVCVVVAFSAIASGACTDPTPWSLASQTSLERCTRCHGDPQAGNAAPPASVRGAMLANDAGVGAHQRHLQGGTMRAGVSCEECHRVPESVDALGHIDEAPAEITFGTLASAGGAAPQWDRETLSCAGTYCHGAFPGGAASVPVWTDPAGSAACGTCHGLPPAAGHPVLAAGTSCSACHPDTVLADGSIDVGGGYHINGAVDVFMAHPDGWDEPAAHGFAANRNLESCKTCHGSDLSGGGSGRGCDDCHGGPAWRTDCTFCHGDAVSGRSSPPVDSQGEAATTLVTVGAHGQHVQPTLSASMDCDVCHGVPANALSPGHIDGRPAEVVFSGLAVAGGASPAWSHAAATCAASYCHGNFEDGKNATAVWTRVDGSQKACNACHGDPPTPSAPRDRHDKHVNDKRFDCNVCHPGYRSRTTDVVNTALHVNGIKDVVLQAGTYNPTTKRCSGTGAGCHNSDTITWQ